MAEHILDGIPADPGEFPHMAAIGYPQIGSESSLSFDCGGTLISHKFVLTAAHCLTDIRRQPTVVRLGKVAIHSTRESDIDGSIDLRIRVNFFFKLSLSIRLKISLRQQMTVHPDYIPREIYNDIGIIELDESVTFTEKIRPTCLYMDVNDPPDNKKLYVTGWGTVNTKSKSLKSLPIYI